MNFNPLDVYVGENRNSKTNWPKVITGWLLITIGVLIIGFSKKIVFPGLERLLGIETIVGKENVQHLADGGYIYTNPMAMVKWVLSISLIGFIISLLGLWLSGIPVRFSFKPKQRR